MTALGGVNSYPSQLEEILNSKQKNIHFIVINKGIPNTGLNYISRHLNEYLEESQPNLVIMMSGIITEGLSTKNSSHHSGIWQKLKIYNLIASLEEKTYNELFTLKPAALVPSPKNSPKVLIDTVHHVLATKIAYHPFSENEKRINNFLKKVYKIEYYLNAQYPDRAIPILLRYIKACSYSEIEKKVWAYDRLVECYTALHQEDQLMFVYGDAVINLPNYDWGYSYLGALLFEQGDFALAGDLFRRNILYRPESDRPYGKLAFCLFKTGDASSAIQLLYKSIHTVPSSMELPYSLAQILLESHKTTEAQIVLEKALKIKPENFNDFKKMDMNNTKMDLYELLKKVYDLNGEHARSAVLKKFISTYAQFQTDTYTKIINLTYQKNIPLVIVQYPLKNLRILVDTLIPSKNVYYVDNELNFKKAVAQEGYYVYFIDNSGGEVGHCTPKGNKLLADNISKTVLDIVGLNRF